MSYLQLFLSGFHSPRLYIGLPMYILGLSSLSYLVSRILVLGGLWSCLLLSSFWSYTVSELSGSRLFFSSSPYSDVRSSVWVLAFCLGRLTNGFFPHRLELLSFFLDYFQYFFHFRLYLSQACHILLDILLHYFQCV